jgi:hypothetical protein
MRRPFFLIFANAMILIVVFALLTQSLFIVQRMAVTTDLKGQVEVQRGGRGNFQGITKGSLIKMNDVLRAQANGEAEFKWLDGTRLRITPDTQLTVKKVSSNAVKRVERSEFRLHQGKVFVRIVKSLRGQSGFEIETPTAVAAVRGTIFSVEVKNGTTQVAVYKGYVEVSSQGKESKEERLIHPGQMAVSGKPGEVETTRADEAEAEFERQLSMIQPELSATARALEGGKRVLLQGRTEAGNIVTVNGRRVPVRGDGGFLSRASLQPGINTFDIISTDKHGAKATVTAVVDTRTNSS